MVYAANYLYHADEVSYTPSNTSWNVNDVSSAINDLYNKVDTSGVINLGEYTENTTIDVSNLNATSSDQFVLMPTQDKPLENYWNLGSVYLAQSSVGFDNGKLELNGTTLSVTLPSVHGYTYTSTDYGGNIYPGHYNKYIPVPCKILYVGNIKESN